MPNWTLQLQRNELTPEDEARFWSRVEKTSSCWIWKGQKHARYGQFRLNGRRYYTHRISFLLAKGYLPSDPRRVLHNCPGGDNGFCVNPNHLWEGTVVENIADMDRKGRRVVVVGSQHGNTRLTEEQVKEIRALKAVTSLTQYEIADLFKVSQMTIQRILCRESWKHC